MAGTTELPLLLKKFLCKYSGYYNGKTYRFILGPQKKLKLVASSNFVPILLIVSREEYNEMSKEYPIDEKSELNKLLALEFASEARAFYHNWGCINGKSKVNVWQFSEKVPDAAMLLPETLLLALTNLEHQISVVTKASKEHGHTKQIYVGKVEKTISSSSSSAIVNSSQRFAISAGVTQLESDRHILNTIDDGAELTAAQQEKLAMVSDTAKFYDFSMLLACGVKQLTLPIINSFLQLPKPENSMQVFKNIALPLFIVLFLYLSCSSLYLAYQHQSLQQQLSSQGDEVSSALDLQQQADSKKVRFHALDSFFLKKIDRSRFWLVMADLFPEAIFADARLVDNRFVIRGNTEKATRILELLSNKPEVADAKFDLPIRRDNNRDSFVISFKLLAKVTSDLSTTQKETSSGRT